MVERSLYSKLDYLELLEEETSCGAARRRVAKKKHTRRRSGSLSRVLSVMGKAIGLGRTPGNSKGESQQDTIPDAVT